MGGLDISSDARLGTSPQGKTETLSPGSGLEARWSSRRLFLRRFHLENWILYCCSLRLSQSCVTSIVPRLEDLPRLEVEIFIHAPDQILESQATVDIQGFDGRPMFLPNRIRYSVCSLWPLWPLGAKSVLGRHGDVGTIQSVTPLGLATLRLDT